MILLRIALLGALIGLSAYSSSSASAPNPLYRDDFYAWRESFTTHYPSGRRVHGPDTQTACYYPAVLAQNDLRNKIAQEQLEATQAQVAAIQQQNALMAQLMQQQNVLITQLLARLYAMQPQAPANAQAQAVPVAHLASSRPSKPKPVGRAKPAPAQKAQQKQADYKSAAK